MFCKKMSLNLQPQGVANLQHTSGGGGLLKIQLLNIFHASPRTLTGFLHHDEGKTEHYNIFQCSQISRGQRTTYFSCWDMITSIRMATKHKVPKMSKATTGNLETDERVNTDSHQLCTIHHRVTTGNSQFYICNDDYVEHSNKIYRLSE